MVASAETSIEKPKSLLGEVARISEIWRGTNNIDMTIKEFILHAEVDKQKYYIERLKEYEAMLHTIGLLAGVVGTEQEQKALRDKVVKIVEEYIENIKIEGDIDEFYYEMPGEIFSMSMFVSRQYHSLIGDKERLKELKKEGWEAHKLNKQINQMFVDFCKSVWNSLVEWWNKFWDTFEKEGLFIALNRLKIDLNFFAAECALDVAISVALAGFGVAAAAALKGLRFVGQRVGKTVTKVVIHAVPDSAKHTNLRAKRLLDVELPDEIIDSKISKNLLNEDKLGGASSLDDIELRQRERPVNPKTTRVHTKGTNSAEVITDPKTGRPSKVKAHLEEDFGGTPRGDNATAIAKQMGDSGDHGGHLIAHRFMGDVPDELIVPQHRRTNLSAFKSMENEWADWLAYGKGKGTKIEIEIEMNVHPPGAVRPDKFTGEYRVLETDASGNQKVIRKKGFNINNDETASFQRISFRTDSATGKRTPNI